jgi:hypothetical protein
VKGDPRVRGLPPDEPQLSPESAKQNALEIENRELRLRVKHLESAVRCAAKTLKPYSDGHS